MVETNVNEFKKKAEEDLSKKLQVLCEEQTIKKEPTIRKRGGNIGDAPTVLTALYSVPYILATVYYGWMIKKQIKAQWHGAENDAMQQEDTEKKVNIWIDESIDRILNLVPINKTKEKDFIVDTKKMIKELSDTFGEKNLVSVSDVISNKMFNILEKYNSNAGSTERENVDYIVLKELQRLRSLL